MKIALAVISAVVAGVVAASLLQSSPAVCQEPAVSQERDSYEYRVVKGTRSKGAELNHLGSLGYRVVHMTGPDQRQVMVFLLEKKKGAKERSF